MVRRRSTVRFRKGVLQVRDKIRINSGRLVGRRRGLLAHSRAVPGQRRPTTPGKPQSYGACGKRWTAWWPWPLRAKHCDRPPAQHQPAHGAVRGNLEALRCLLDQSFLAEGGWSPAAEVLVPAPGHPLVGFGMDSATDASRFRQPVVSLGARCAAPLGRMSHLQLSVSRPGASARRP